MSRARILTAFTTVFCGIALFTPLGAKAQDYAGLDPTQVIPRPEMIPPSHAALPLPRVLFVRVARHGARTRVVLDIKGKPNFDHHTTSSGRSVLVSFPGVRWFAPLSSRKTGGLVRRYLFSGREDGGGDLALLTSEPVDVMKAFTLPPREGTDHWRVVFDLMPKSALAPN